MQGGASNFFPFTMRKVFFVFAFTLVAGISLMMGAQQVNAATVTIVSGTITNSVGTGVSGIHVELHTSNQSVTTSGTTNGSGVYTMQLDDSAANGQELTLEFTPPTGYNRPSDVPYQFTYTIGDAAREKNFTLVEATKTINITVVTTTGAPVERFDMDAIPLGDNSKIGVAANGEGNTDSLAVTGGRWAVSVNRNLSEQEPTRYPWVPIGGSQEVTFADDSTTESVNLTFEVVSSQQLVTVKPVDADGDILTQNNFNGDVTFVGFTEYGAVSTYAKVNQTTGVASLYLPPGIYRIDAFHQQQLEGQSFDPDEATFVVDETPGTHDLGTLQAQTNSAMISGKVVLLSPAVTASQFKKQSDTTASITATNVDTGKSSTGTTQANGEFAFSQLGAGHYSITVNDPSYISKTSATVDVNAGDVVTGLEVSAIQAPVRISGNIVNGDGDVIEDVSATVLVIIGDTQFSGEVSPEGAYSVALYKSANEQATVQLVTQKGATVYQQTELQVTVSESGTVTQNIVVEENEATISGALTNANTAEQLTSETFGDGASVVAMNLDNGSTEESDVEDDGTYQLSVGPGEWKLVPKIRDIEADALSRTTVEDSITVAAGESATGQNVSVFVNAGTVTGTIVDASGEPVPEARVLLTNGPALQAAADANGTSVDPDDVITVLAKTGTDGSFSEEVPNGSFTAFVSENPTGGTDIAPAATEVTVAGDTAALGTLEFSEASATVSGAVAEDVLAGKVVYYNESGESVEAEIVDGAYSVGLTPGAWTAIFSGSKDGELVLSQESVTVVEGVQTNNFKKVQSTGIDIPAASQATCDATEPCTVSTLDGAEVRLAPYAAALEGDITVQVAPIPNVEVSEGNVQIGGYDVNVWDSNGFEISQLQRPVDITVPVTTELLDKNVSKKDLQATFLQDRLEMALTDGIASEVTKNELHIQTDHLTPFAVSTSVENFQAVQAPGKVKSKKLKSVKVTKSGATLKWKKPTSGAQVTKYQLQLRKYKVKKKKNWTTYKNVTKITKKVNELKANTRYEFRVKACNESECSTYTTWKKFKTKK